MDAPAYFSFWFGFCFIFAFYILFSSFLQFFYYHRSRNNSDIWKIQPHRKGNVGKSASEMWIPMLELLGRKRKQSRAPNHALYSTINLLFASTFAGAVAYTSTTGKNRLVFSVDAAGGLTSAVAFTCLALLWESVIEYYWHRMMHLPWFYKRFHKVHHFYTSPEPFDDMYIHPVEAFGYYCILYSPPFVMPLHFVGFFIYMAIMGTFGVLDHCGIRFSILGVYNSADHDIHHSCFNVNYGFPFSFTDMLHGTYVSAKREAQIQADGSAVLK
jgi:sterol desaturase/sphingolipid hydroxylase (fatty acid hydroxylase superfamily)